MQIGHDGEAPGTGWFLKEVDVDMPTKGRHYHFECRQWLARDRANGHTSCVLNVDDGTSTIMSYRPSKSFASFSLHVPSYPFNKAVVVFKTSPVIFPVNACFLQKNLGESKQQEKNPKDICM